MLITDALLAANRQQPVVADVNPLVEIAPIELGIIGIIQIAIIGVEVGVGDNTGRWIRVFRRVLAIVIGDPVLEGIIARPGRSNDKPAGSGQRHDGRHF